MTEHPLAVVNRAREIWLRDRQGGLPLSFAEVAKRVNAEFGLNVTRKCVTEWSKRFAWSESPELAGSVPPPTDPACAPGADSSALSAPVEPDPEDEPEFNWDWEERKLKFLGRLTNIAEECLSVGKGPDGKVVLLFKDMEARVKTGLAAVEMIGKINSGKFEVAEKGDALPALSKAQLSQVFNFFYNQGAPEPKIDPLPVIDVEFVEVPDAKQIEPPSGEVLPQ